MTVLWTLVAYRRDRRVLWLAIAVAVLYPLQAVLGGITVALELPPEWVTLHLANAELLLATLTILAVVVRWPAAMPERFGAWTWIALAAAIGTFVLMLTGAYVRGANATSACLGWPLCGGAMGIPTFGAPAVAMAHRYAAGAVGVIV